MPSATGLAGAGGKRSGAENGVHSSWMLGLHCQISGPLSDSLSQSMVILFARNILTCHSLLLVVESFWRAFTQKPKSKALLHPSAKARLPLDSNRMQLLPLAG